MIFLGRAKQRIKCLAEASSVTELEMLMHSDVIATMLPLPALLLVTSCQSCMDPEGGGGDKGPGPLPPPEKSQKYRVS